MSTYGSHVCGGGGIVYKVPICYTMFLLLQIPYTDIKKNYSYREVNPLVPRCSL